MVINAIWAIKDDISFKVRFLKEIIHYKFEIVQVAILFSYFQLNYTTT